MEYKYDPILCMNIPVEKINVKTNDKAGEMWFLYIDGKSIAAFESWGAPVKEAKEYMKKNNIKGVGTLKKIGRGGSFTITAKDADKYVEKAIKVCDSTYVVEYNGSYKTFSSMQQAITEYNRAISDRNIRGKKVKLISVKDPDAYASGAEKGNIIKSNDSISSVDKAIKACDRFTVWESDDEDIYVSYENGTYVLYVDGRPQADGNQQKMIQLAKQEERMRD